MNKNKNEKKETTKEENKKGNFFSRRDFLAGSTGLATGLALGSGASSFLFPKEENIQREVEVLNKKYACPFCGDSVNSYTELRTHILNQHQKKNEIKKPGVKEVEEPTYERMIIDELNRFNPKQVAFSRSIWDEEYRERLLQVSSKTEMPQGGFFSFMTPHITRDYMINSLQSDGAMHVANNFGNIGGIPYGYVHQTGTDGLYTWKNPVNEEKTEINNKEEITQHIKKMAKAYGASLVGVTELDSRWVYTHQNREGMPPPQPGEELSLDGAPAPESETNISYDYAIVMAVEQEWWRLRKSPESGHTASTRRGYDDMAVVSSRLAEFIRGLGYAAVPSGNDTTQSIPLAIDAGLGQIGRNGLLVTPQLGSRERICKVYTNLPLKEDKPIDFGLQSYCENCGVCARVCPADAVPPGDRTTETTESNREGMKRWAVDTPACLAFWIENDGSCSNCQAFCPWSNPEFKRNRYGPERNKELWGESRIYDENFKEV